MRREVGRDIAVDRLALGLHRAALGGRDLLADPAEIGGIAVRQSGRARGGIELVGAGQRAVDEQIGIASDRAGEMGVGAEREAEMPLVDRGIISLGLGAQDLLHHLRPEIGLADPLEQMVEGGRADDLAERELDVEGLQIFLERDQFLAARRLVDAVHDRRLLRFQRLGRGDVGGDHIILDQPMRIEPFARRDREDPALLVEHDPALGQVEIERGALVARLGERRPAGP